MFVLREIDVPDARGRVDVELVRVERNPAAPERERSDLEAGRGRVRRVVGVAAVEHHLRDVRPRFLAAVGRVVDERMQHSVVASDVDHRRARRLGRLESVVAGIRRARRAAVGVGSARGAYRHRGRIDDIAEHVRAGAEARRVDAFVRFVAAQEIQHRLRGRGRSHDAPSGRERRLLRGGEVREAERNRQHRSRR